MSLVQVWIEDDRARVAVDTVVHLKRSASSLSEASKLIHLPHAGTVIAYRGSGLAFFQVFAQIYLTQGNGGFDAIVEAMPKRVSDASKQWQAGLPEAAARIELHVVGYSDKQQRMALVSFEVDLGAGSVDVSPLNGGPCRSAPGFKSVPALDNDAAMFDLAREQLDWMRTHKPADATGGRLLIADLRKDSVTIRDAGLIERSPPKGQGG